MQNTMKSIKILLIVILTVNFSFSQNGSKLSDYPKLIVWEGDSLVAVTKTQLNKLNFTYVQKEKYRELSDSLTVLVDNYKGVTHIYMLAYDELHKALAEKEKASKESVKLVGILKADIQDFEDNAAKLEKQKKFWKATTYISTSIMAILSILLSLN